MITITSGDLFDDDAEIKVNTINCVGVMGKGVALEFKKRYPLMFSEYKKACSNSEVVIGKLHVWNGSECTILNFPTKTHWSCNSEYEYIDSGLDALVEFLKNDSRKIAIPALGCTNGGLDWNIVKEKIVSKLSGLPNEIVVYKPLSLQETVMSNLPKFWMIDDNDLFLATKKLQDVRNGQLKDWDWCRFCDDDYKNEAEAFDSYMIEISCASMFNPGKIIVFYGIPSFQAKMAAKLDAIGDNILVVVMAPIDKTTSLFLKAEKYKYSKIEEKTVFKVRDRNGNLDNREAVEWTEQRGKLLGLSVDKRCCAAIADSCSYKQNLIHAELYKLKHASHDGQVTRQLMEMVATNIGDASIMLLCDAIMANNGTEAHTYLQRLIDHGEDGVKMCGFFMDWARKMAIAQSCNGDIAKYESVLKSIMKAEKKDEKIKTVPMFESVAGIHNANKNLNKSNKSANFPYDLIASIGRLQIALRGGHDYWKYDDQTLLLHRFVASLITKEPQ